jgi:hypothetical protein
VQQLSHAVERVGRRSQQFGQHGLVGGNPAAHALRLFLRPRHALQYASSGCSALGGLNRMNAILGTSDSCIAVHPSDMCALAVLEAKSM